MADWHISFLGARTPVREIVRAASLSEADAVVVSFSMNVDRDDAADQLDELREQLDSTIQLVVGGAGTPDTSNDVSTFSDLESFYAWAFQHAHDD